MGPASPLGEEHRDEAGEHWHDRYPERDERTRPVEEVAPPGPRTRMHNSRIPGA